MSMNKYIGVLLVPLIAVCCDDVLEKNIEDDTINLRAPQDATNVTPGTVQLWWDELDGATQYNVQIVTPDQSSPDRLVKDTVITTNKLNMKFKEGVYEWC